MSITISFGSHGIEGHAVQAVCGGVGFHAYSTISFDYIISVGAHTLVYNDMLLIPNTDEKMGIQYSIVHIAQKSPFKLNIIIIFDLIQWGIR